MTRIPGVGAKTVRRIYDETGIATTEELRAAAEAGELRELRGLGAKFEENVLAGLDRIADEGDEERRLLRDVREVGNELVAALSASEAAEKVVLAGSARRWTDTCKDIDIVATASEPLDAGDRARRPPADRGGRATRATTASGPGPTTASRSTCGSSRRRSSATCCSTSPARRPTTSSSASGRVKTRALGLRARDRRRRERRGHLLRGRERRLRASRPRLHRAGAARGPRTRSPSPSAGRAAGAGHGGRHPRGSALPHDPLRRQEHARGDGGGGPRARLLLPRDHRPLREPWLRRRRPAAGAARSGSRRSPTTTPSTGRRRFRLLAGSEVNIITDGSLDYADDVLEQLDWVVASVHTSFRISKREMTDRVDRGGPQPAGQLPRPPDRADAAAPRALRHRHRGGGRRGGRTRGR